MLFVMITGKHREGTRNTDSVGKGFPGQRCLGYIVAGVKEKAQGRRWGWGGVGTKRCSKEALACLGPKFKVGSGTG